MYYAYIRVSTDHQHVENQKHEINIFAQKKDIQINKWVDETISSRKPLQELIKDIKKSKCHFRIITSENDVLLVTHNMSKLVNDGKVKILYMKDGHLIDTNN